MSRLPTFRYLVAIGLAVTAVGFGLGPAFAGSVPQVASGGEIGDEQPSELVGEVRSAEFGDGPLDAVISAAVAAAPRSPCAVTPNQLAALLLAPVWAETVSNELTSAPSPMTLSRYDHGSERLFVTGSTTPTGGPVPFWHPGIGLWQMDSAGLGALWTADQRIDARIAAQLIAPTVAGLWCDAGFELVWADWFACQRFDCAETYVEIYDPATDTLQNLDRTAIAATGGMQYRLCRFGGVDHTCGWIDPGLAEGNAAFAVDAFGPAPITTPFYAMRSGTDEVRIWLAQHSGLSQDIVARRPLGSNARSSVSTTVGAADFCDVTTSTGVGCTAAEPTPIPATPIPPTPVAATPAPATTCEGIPATIQAVAGQATTGTPQADVIVGTAGADVIDGGAGDDLICAGPGDDSIIGGDGNDRLSGEGGNDVLWGQDGDDLLFGGDGDDRLRGGDDNDYLFGQAGADDLGGGRDDDHVYGGSGADPAVRGGTGDDLVDGGDGADLIINGNGGQDTVFGGAGDDALVAGGPRPDVVRGGDGADTVKGLGGADQLYGDAGDDELFGGKQPDVLDGGAGIDACNGGAQSDSATACESLTAVP